MANMVFSLPIKGFSEGLPVEKSDPMTSGYLNNVRSTGVLDKRIKISQRPAVVNWGGEVQIGAAEEPVVFMCTVSTVE